MRVLFLTQVLPYPLDAGPKVRAYYTLRHVAARHAVTLASFVRPSDSPQALQHLQGCCETVLTCPMPRSRLRDALALGRSALTGEPLLIARDRVPAMHARLRALAAESGFDVVHADQLWMAPYALGAAAAQPARRPRLVLDQHNAVYLIPARLAASARSPLARLGWRREAGLMSRYEARACHAFDQVVTVTRADREALLRLYPKAEPPAFGPVIPICLEPLEALPLSRPASQPGILFIGGMHWPPNADGVTWFSQEVLPAVRAAVPEATLWAIGKQPPAGLAALPLFQAGGIHAPGYVEDTDPYWARCRVFVVPLRAGGGMRVKILEAWARGLPVVSTTIGAEGLACRPGEDILLADTPEALAQAVSRVLQDDSLAQRLATSGRQTVARHYDWRAVYPAWDAVYERAGSA